MSVRDVEEYFKDSLESNLVTQLRAYSSLIVLKIEEHIHSLKELEQSSKVNAETKSAKLSGKQLRPFGLCIGEFVVPDDFDAPLPEEILRVFEGK
ncbi:MAG: type II toxin-antitoxin system Phd/YefM family antitoxin [Cyanothece sp. SIO2G6]|nr:type II toxin-antitoxin system Phd/YefM family antitoxin [Cyanothece sp. SIO2G6]